MSGRLRVVIPFEQIVEALALRGVAITRAREGRDGGSVELSLVGEGLPECPPGFFPLGGEFRSGPDGGARLTWEANGGARYELSLPTGTRTSKPPEEKT